MWVERLVCELISTSSPMFATEWPGFHRFSRDPSLITFFNGSLLVVGHGIFASTILKYRKYIVNNIVMLLIMFYGIYFRQAPTTNVYFKTNKEKIKQILYNSTRRSALFNFSSVSDNVLSIISTSLCIMFYTVMALT